MTWITAPKRQRLPRLPRLPRPKESDVQKGILAALSAKGYVVLKHLPPRKSTKKQANLPGVNVDGMRGETIGLLLKQATQGVQNGQTRGIVWRNNTGVVPIGEGKDKRFVRMGAPGMSDILGVKYQPMKRDDGRELRGYPILLAIEVKRPGGKRQPGQAEFLELVRAMGGIALLVDDPAAILASEEL